MPAVPGDAIQVLVVLPKAVVDAIEVGVCAAVVPVSTCDGKQSAPVSSETTDTLGSRDVLKPLGSASQRSTKPEN